MDFGMREQGCVDRRCHIIFVFYLLLLTLPNILRSRITLWNRFLLYTLAVSEMFKKCTTFYTTRRLVMVFTNVRHFCVFWASWIHCTPSHFIFRSVLTLFSHLYLYFPISSFLQVFQQKPYTYNSKLRPTRYKISWLIYLFYSRCTSFRPFLRPSLGAHSCSYSFRYWNSISFTVAASSSIGWQYLKLYVQLCAPDDGQRNRLKHVERL
jgi:hypothetical protein